MKVLCHSYANNQALGITGALTQEVSVGIWDIEFLVGYPVLAVLRSVS